MGFVGVYKAIYDYAPQGEGELQISEGDLLYIIEKSTEDDWWKAKKKASAEDEDEPVGLVPNNYVEEAETQGKARALYEYTRQTDEELSFPEDAQLDVYDTSDPDWILVGHNGDYGFVPANYIEMMGVDSKEQEAEEEPPAPAPPPLPARTPSTDVQSPPLPARNPPSSDSAEDSASPTAPNPATMIAGLMAARAGTSHQPPAPLNLSSQKDASEDESDSIKSPPLPARPRGDSQLSPDAARSSAPVDRRSRVDYEPPKSPNTAPLTPGDFHMYNINEMVSIMGKKKKMPTTLGINLRTGIILIAPEYAQDGPSQEWTADKMTHYSREGKHVFMELVKPSKSIDFHAGAKDTAEEIVAMLGELAGAVRAEGLREVILAGTQKTIQQKKGIVLYDFDAQGDDEVTVTIGDEVVILDDTKSDEWWMVRRVKNQKEGVVPSSYIEVTGILDTPASTAIVGVNAGKSTVEQNRLEELRLTKEALKAGQREDQRERERERERERTRSEARKKSNTEGQQRSRRENGSRSEASGSSRSNGKSKPDPAKVRTWTDRTKSFTVEAQFLGVKDGKFHLHKLNGVRIAVPISKMSLEDLEYVERQTGLSLDEDKPLSDLKKKGDSSRAAASSSSSAAPAPKVGATVEPKKPEYDWFQFFLTCDVSPALCNRYAQAFARESMDESVLPDVDASVLRNLGFREGDILKVMRYLDTKYCRGKKANAGGEEVEGGLFSGPGGALRNNTRKGRPAPPVETNNTVDAKALTGQKESAASEAKAGSPTTAQAAPKPTSGFEDDAWSVKPSKTPEPAPEKAPAPPATTSSPAPAPAPTAPAEPAPAAKLTGAMSDLSLLTKPLEPEKVQPPAPPPALNLAPAPTSAPAPAPAAATAPAQIPQPTGATPQFFSGMPLPAVNGQQPQFTQQLPQAAIARQRPIPPQYTQGQGGLVPPPPPSRPLSAPQVAQPSQFTPPALQPHMTGYAGTQVAPPGQSLNDLAQARLQQQYAQLQQQPIMPIMTGMQPAGPFIPQPTGVTMPLGAQAIPAQQLPMQPTGFVPQVQQQQPMATGLPQPLEPQRTAVPGVMPGLQMQPTGFAAAAPMQQTMLQPQPTGLVGQAGGGLQQPLQPLVPHKTGPPPPVKFGITEGAAKKLAPQPTGRRANLAAATPDNPFGF
ncbi:hypothetical protein VTJ49DRAFT_6264 [Mycothermus thermophilus]|uniref:Actin cytoskeleton-regulatory complex protein SLA1 n=1 Tax=Humicola insolens TaxID=85995 RepID=A0ABR3V1J9_HUMIN